MNFNIALILISGFFVLASATQMSSCTDSTGIYPNVTYSINSYVCESSPCTCTLGCASVINVDFQAQNGRLMPNIEKKIKHNVTNILARYLEKIKPKIHATCMGVELDYPLDQDDACKGFTNTQCPVVKNEKINYQYSLTIPAIFPEVTVTLRFSLIDEELSEDVVCFEWDVKVKKDTCPS